MGMSIKDKVKNIFSYLLSVKNMNEDLIRNVNQYEKLFWQVNLFNIGKCEIKEKSEEWLIVDKNSKKIYDELFQLYLLLEKDKDNLEIIWGHGLLVWDFKGTKLKYPMFTTKMQLIFEAEKGKFILKPCRNHTVLEGDILQGINLPNMDKILNLKREFQKSNLDPRKINNIKEILYKIVHYISSDINPDGEIQEQLVSDKYIKFSKYPVIYNAPVIILRKNDNRLWHSELTNVINAIDEGYEIPFTVKALTEEESFLPNKEIAADINKSSQNLFFPLVANEDQRKIVKKLKQNYGLVVQGPPGTGKSHTIVNLLCHLLAEGKRVLVTSQTGRALKVLSEKIPESIKPLCISILGDDTTEIKQLDNSVRKITENLSLDDKELLNEIVILENQLVKCKKKIDDLNNNLKESEKIENEKVNYRGKFYKLIDIAKWVNANEKTSNWIEDNVSSDEKCPLTDQQMVRFIYILNNISKEDIIKINKATKALEKLPVCEKLCKNIERFKGLNEHFKEYKNNIKNWAIPYNNNWKYKDLIALIDKAIDDMKLLDDTWMKNLMKSYYSSDLIKTVIKQFVCRCEYDIEKIKEIKQTIALHQISIPDYMDNEELKISFELICNQLKDKSKITKIFKMKHSKVEHVLKECTIDNEKITNLEQAKLVQLFITEEILKQNIVKLWNTVMNEYGAKQIVKLDLGTIVDLEQNLKYIKMVTEWDEKYRSKIIKLLGNVAVLEKLDWYKEETYEYLKKGLVSERGLYEYNVINVYIENLKKVLISSGDMENLKRSIENYDIKEIEKEYKEINRLTELMPNVKESNLYYKRLQESCPKMAKSMFKDDKKERYKSFNKAWKWSQLNNLLEKTHKINPDIFEKAIEEQKRKQNILIQQIVSKKAWYNEMLKTTDVQKRSLYAWLQVVKKLGKGRSKFYSKYRNMAQKEMEKCKDIIPVWIMPLNRVIENIKMDDNLFDVVIIDESSQCDIFALSALMRAKKAVIVGDDMQISPQPVGIDGNVLNGLMQRYLKDIPHSEWFDLETSLYSTALRVFPDRILLKEHFRCVPEIIGFSNELCYSGEIIPLRRPKPKEIFKSPIKTIKVKDGVRSKTRPINIKEAESVTEQIVNCCEDEKYNNMTMGVISLLGQEQGELIEGMLKEKLGETEMIKRKLICGDAYSFQGDERDVMFLSMVVANNVKFMSLTKESDIRRFNVAASRAKNQMWVFYSVDIKNINSTCVRSKLLRYCLDPSRKCLEDSKNEYIFTSEFQKDVYNIIKQRGYKVVPFVKIGKCKVDFIIEGANNRIVVDCDGGIWNGIEYWQKKNEREMSLERVGWTFYRIRGSEFYRNSEKTMKKLWDKLDKLGIQKIIA